MPRTTISNQEKMFDISDRFNWYLCKYLWNNFLLANSIMIIIVVLVHFIQIIAEWLLAFCMQFSNTSAICNASVDVLNYSSDYYRYCYYSIRQYLDFCSTRDNNRQLRRRQRERENEHMSLFLFRSRWHQLYIYRCRYLRMKHFVSFCIVMT